MMSEEKIDSSLMSKQPPLIFFYIQVINIFIKP